MTTTAAASVTNAEDDNGDDNGEEHEPANLPINIIDLGTGARRVIDADEEIFLLYTLSPALPGRYGLGQADSKHDLLAISFDLQSRQPPEVERSCNSGSSGGNSSSGNSSSSSSSRNCKTSSNRRGIAHASTSRARGGSAAGIPSSSAVRSSSTADPTIISALLYQDSTSLRSTAGDTGSVVWRSSLLLCACIARQVHLQSRGDRNAPSLLTRDVLLHGVRSKAKTGKDIQTPECGQRLYVLELGAGTGVLPAILVPFFQHRQLMRAGLHWTATDLESLMPLLRRNTSDTVLSAHQLPADDHGVSFSARPLDWLHAASLLHSTSSYAGGASSLRRSLAPPPPSSSASSPSSSYPDLLIAVDCIFNPALFDPLLDTIDLFTLPGHTMVLLLVELRSAEAMREFLESWLRRDGGWRIWTVGNEQMMGMERGYVAWIGWKESRE